MSKEKDAYWFRHDSNSGRGLRLKKLQAKYNHWGKGVYWDIIEVLREQSGYRYENSPEALQLLSELIGIKSSDNFTEFFSFCVGISLFKIKGGFFYSEVLTKNMKSWETKKTNGSKGGRPKSGGKKNLNETESESETKANGNHNIREEERIEQLKDKSEKKNQVSYSSLNESFFQMLPNSPELETICMQQELEKNYAVSMIIEFKKFAEPSYQNFRAFVYHFSSWIRRQREKAIEAKNKGTVNGMVY